MELLSMAVGVARESFSSRSLVSWCASILSTVTVVGWALGGIAARPTETIVRCLDFLGAPTNAVEDVAGWFSDPVRQDILVAVLLFVLAGLLLTQAWLRWSLHRELNSLTRFAPRGPCRGRSSE